MKLPFSGLLLSIEAPTLFENVEKRQIISFYFKQVHSMEASVYSSTNLNSTAKW